MTDLIPNSANTDVSYQQITLPEFDSALARVGDEHDPELERELPRNVRATLLPLIAALRWSALVLGLALGGPDAADGDLSLVITTAMCLFLTVWRTMRPIRLAATDALNRALSIGDGVILGVAVGIGAGFTSPFVFCIVACAGVAAFGWGMAYGIAALSASLLAMIVTAALTDGEVNLDITGGWLTLLAAVLLVVVLGLFRVRLVDAERRRAQLAGRIDALAETNQLLHVLNRVARTLPSSLDLRQAVGVSRDQLVDTFDASIIGLLARSEVAESWSPLIAEGLAIPPSVDIDELPRHLRAALDANGPLLVADLQSKGMGASTGSGIYTALRTRGKTVGLLAVEHNTPDRYTERDARLLGGLAEALALTLDNARWFQRLRILGAEEERARIARDLHDRVGQWLTYISFELERIMMADPAEAPELSALHGDVGRAIDELRETLRQMRASVTDEQSLQDVASELTSRFEQRTGIQVGFETVESGERLPRPVENELLRIMQEALTNVDKHAGATSVSIHWNVDEAGGRLRIKDDGTGFDSSSGIRETAFGLVGMRERAEVIGAQLNVTSAPGGGTTIDVVVPRED